MGDGLTTQERIDKEFDEIDGLVAEWKEEAPAEANPADSGTPAPAPAAEGSADQGSANEEDSKAGQPVQQTPQEAPEIARLREEKRVADARYQTLQGMINKLNEELTSLKSRHTEQPHTEQPQAKPVINSDEPETDEDYRLLVEEYGEPAAKAMKNLAGKALEAAKKESGALKEELEQAKQTTGALVAAAEQTAEDRYFTSLEREVPEWKKINGSVSEGIPQDPRFTEFLTQTVPFQEYTYNDLLQYHHTNGNVAKVAEIFKAAIKPTAEATTPAPTAKNPLEQLIEPEKTGKGTPAPNPAGNKKTFTKAEIQRFDNDYMQYQSGRLKADPVKIEARWNEIQDAIAEGRVR